MEAWYGQYLLQNKVSFSSLYPWKHGVYQADHKVNRNRLALTFSQLLAETSDLPFQPVFQVAPDLSSASLALYMDSVLHNTDYYYYAY